MWGHSKDLQLMGGGVDVAATTGIVGVLGNESVVKVQ
jgi:hypothetical protein